MDNYKPRKKLSYNLIVDETLKLFELMKSKFGQKPYSLVGFSTFYGLQGREKGIYTPFILFEKIGRIIISRETELAQLADDSSLEERLGIVAAEKPYEIMIYKEATGLTNVYAIFKQQDTPEEIREFLEKAKKMIPKITFKKPNEA